MGKQIEVVWFENGERKRRLFSSRSQAALFGGQIEAQGFGVGYSEVTGATTIAVATETQEILRECVEHLNRIKSDGEPRYRMGDLAGQAIRELRAKLVGGKQ